MNKYDTTGTQRAFRLGVRICAGILALLPLLAAGPVIAADYSISGESDTIFRMGKTTDKKDSYPLYEYLRLSVASTDKNGNTTSLHVGGWARGDLADKTARDRYTDADLQYGYVSYQGAKNNLVINAGRQFVSEGVATERLDGLYARNDFAAGFAAAAYIGAPVTTEPDFKADDLVFGGRVTQSNYKYYTVGVSALKSYSGSDRYREEEGFDLWVHPTKQLDLTGRSSYNSITNGWMEHDYSVSFAPIDKLRLYADLSNINYKDYFYKVTTTALIFNPLTNGIDPNEKLLTLGGGVTYTALKNLTISADYKNYQYDIARDANYYGGKITYALPGTFGTGFSIHRMDGKTDTLKYTEYRLYATKKLGKADLTLDLIDLNYDNATAMKDTKNAVTVVGAGSYECSKNLQLGAYIDYSHNPLFDNEVKGLVKMTYLFDVKRSTEGRTNSEK